MSKLKKLLISGLAGATVATIGSGFVSAQNVNAATVGATTQLSFYQKMAYYNKYNAVFNEALSAAKTIDSTLSQNISKFLFMDKVSLNRTGNDEVLNATLDLVKGSQKVGTIAYTFTTDLTPYSKLLILPTYKIQFTIGSATYMYDSNVKQWTVAIATVSPID